MLLLKLACGVLKFVVPSILLSTRNRTMPVGKTVAKLPRVCRWITPINDTVLMLAVASGFHSCEVIHNKSAISLAFERNTLRGLTLGIVANTF